MDDNTPFDLDGDDEFGPFEVSILAEHDENLGREEGFNNKGCCFIFLIFGSALVSFCSLIWI